MNLDLIISTLLKKERIQQNLTKSLVASTFGAKANYLTKIENGLTELNYEVFYKICLALKREPKYFLDKLSVKKGYTVTRKLENYNNPIKIFNNEDYFKSGGVEEFSLIENNEIEEFFTPDFRINLSFLEKNSQTYLHYEDSERFSLVLEGDVKYEFINNKSKAHKARFRELNSVLIGNIKQKKNDHYIFINERSPYKEIAGNSGAIVLNILLHKRQQNISYNFTKHAKSDNFFIRDNDDFSNQSLMTGLGILIKNARINSHLSSSKVATLVGLRSAADLYKIENYLVTPKLKTILNLAKLLNLKLDELFPNPHDLRSFGKFNNLSYSNNKYISVERVVSYKNEKFSSDNYDVSFFVVSGAFEFITKNENGKVHSFTLKKWDNVYIKKGTEYILRNFNLIKSEALLIHKK